MPRTLPIRFRHVYVYTPVSDISEDGPDCKFNSSRQSNSEHKGLGVSLGIVVSANLIMFFRLNHIFPEKAKIVLV
jgi:hypothetical protein